MADTPNMFLKEEPASLWAIRKGSRFVIVGKGMDPLRLTQYSYSAFAKATSPQPASVSVGKFEDMLIYQS